MVDGENEPSLPLLSSSPATSEGGDAVILVQESEIDACVGFIISRLKEKKCPGNIKEDPMFSIPRVPHRLRRGKNFDAYEPEIISIGPYHHGNPRLQAMESMKFNNLDNILSQNLSLSLQKLVEKLKPLEDQVRRCYSDKFKLSSNEFVEMMLLDSCFILHLLVQASKDPNLAGLIWISPLMLYDLLLLENQLPFFLVQHVYDIISGGESSSSLLELAYDFYCLVTRQKNYEEKNKVIPSNEQVHHLLQLYHCFNILPLVSLPQQKPESKWIDFIHILHVLKNRFRFTCENVLNLLKKEQYYDNIPTRKSEEKQEEIGIMIPTATVLHEAGIKFRKSKGRNILDVKFNGRVLEIPPLFMHDGGVSLFHNLIALEQCNNFYFSDSPQFTAYFKFMDHLINNVGDVALLQKNGIIEHAYGSEKEVAHLFNQLTRGATINPNNYLSGLYKELNKYCKQKRHIWGAMFLKRHCRNPLTILSAIGFLFLLSLTFLQSYFSVYAYFRPPA